MNRLPQHFYKKLHSLIRGGNQQLNGYITQFKRWQSQNDANAVTEEQITRILKEKFPGSQCIKVDDVSGGCGAMFNVYIESSEFKGLSIPKQHRTVYDSLSKQIKNIHGLHLETKVAP